MARKIAILLMLGAVVLALAAPVAFAQEEELGMNDVDMDDLAEVAGGAEETHENSGETHESSGEAHESSGAETATDDESESDEDDDDNDEIRRQKKLQILRSILARGRAMRPRSKP